MWFRFHYETWRPETAIQRKDIWLPSGHNVSDPSWTPLITPTPIEQEYSSGHGTVGGAAAAALKIFNGGDVINVTVSSLVTQAPQHVLTRHFVNLTAAGYEIGTSRVYGGVSTSEIGCCLGLTTNLFADSFHILSRQRRRRRLAGGPRYNGAMMCDYLWSSYYNAEPSYEYNSPLYSTCLTQWRYGKSSYCILYAANSHTSCTMQREHIRLYASSLLLASKHRAISETAPSRFSSPIVFRSI